MTTNPTASDTIAHQIEKVVTFYENNLFPSYSDFHSMYYMDNRERGRQLQDYQTNVSAGFLPRIIKTYAAHMRDNLVRFYTMGNSDQDLERSEATKSFLEWCYQVSKAKTKIHESLLDCFILGEGYLKTTWFSKERKMVNKNTGKETVWTKEHPDLQYVSTYDVFVDPAAKDFYSARYIIERKIVSKEELMNNPFFDIGKEKLQQLADQGAYFLEKEWNMKKVEMITRGRYQIDNDRDNNEFAFDNNNYFEVMEYWSEDKLRIYVNGERQYEGENPMPLQEIPFYQITYSKESGTVRGTGISFLVQDYEKYASSILNIFLDDAKLKANSPLGKVTADSQVEGLCGTKDIVPGEVIEVSGPNDLFPLNIGQLKMEIISVMQYLEALSYGMAGVNEYVMGSLMTKVDRSAAAVSGRIQGFKVRMLPLLDSLNQAIGRIAKAWMAMGIVQMEEGAIMKILDEETKAQQIETFDPESLDMEFDVIFDSQALKSAMKEIRTQQLMQFFTIATQLIANPVTGMPMIDLQQLLEELAHTMEMSDDFVMTPEESEEFMKEAQAAQQRIQQSGQQPAQQQGGVGQFVNQTPQQLPQPQAPQTVAQQNGEILAQSFNPV